MTPAALADEVRRRAGTGPARFIVGVAGPPGSGKSTLAEALAHALCPGARVVPMDGFHYDNAVLDARGLRARKGAPETFDVAGFLHLMQRLRAGGDVAIPVFDRSMELSRAAADVVTDADRFLVVEGNYLLLNEPPWHGLAPFLDVTVYLNVAEAELERRLMQRWLGFGRTEKAAHDWVWSNDMPNARRVTQGSRPADVVIAGA